MSRRNARSGLVTSALEGRNAWNCSPHTAGAIPAWNRRFPNLDLVADGRRCAVCRDSLSNGGSPAVCGDCFSSAGRGTTGFDLFRMNGVRADFLSIKTDTIEKSGKLPSKISLSTGNVETLQALIDGINEGAALPTVVFASKNGEDGPESEGLAIFLDLGEVIRAGVPTQPPGGYGKGKAPPVYFKWSSRRSCGGKHKKAAREGLEFPHFDEQGRMWSTPEHVHYRELNVSLSAMGIKRASWVPMNVGDLAEFVEGQDWHTMAWGSELVG